MDRKLLDKEWLIEEIILAIIPHAFIHINEQKARLRWIILEKAIIFFKS